ncbi:MAG: hypothetical protein KTR14_03410 [Vampirovibrio sp.]|nr:hypothetical protein [Vampirovibrio sp.]
MDSHQQSRHKKSSGNSLIEYVIPLGLLAMACIAAAQMMVQPIPDELAKNLGGNRRGNSIMLQPLGSGAATP